MNNPATWLYWIIIIKTIGSIHGIVLSLILFWSARKDRPANRFLGWFVMSLSLVLLGSLYKYSSLFVDFPQFDPIVETPVFTCAPFLWFYLNKLTNPSFQMSRRSLSHFIPALLFLLLHLPVLLRISSDQLWPLESGNRHEPWDLIIVSVFAILQAYAYSWSCIRILQRHARVVRETYSTVDKIDLAWMRIIIVAFIAVWSVFLVSLLLLDVVGLGKTPFFSHHVAYLLVACTIFVIGYKGLLRSASVAPSGPPDDADLRETTDFAVEEGSCHAAGPADGTVLAETRYQKSTLRTDQAELILQRLLTAMEEAKPYLDPDLTLPQLAGQLKVSSHHLSQAINERLQLNFFRLVNQYRINDAKCKLSHPQESRNKLITVAFDVGFQSISTFNRVFKEFTGLSPSEYRKRHAPVSAVVSS